MTREKAIEIMQINRDGVANMSRSEDRTKTLAAFDMAIKALEREPCEDAISRAAAEALFRNARSKLNPSDYKTADEFNTRDLMLLNAEQFIHLLPSVNPQEPQSGYWQKHTDASGNSWHACPACGHIAYTLTRFCPDCGACLETPS